ncbi:MAG: hypothetical protein Q9227_007533 [Pyrenula ochraceoflavens]
MLAPEPLERSRAEQLTGRATDGGPTNIYCNANAVVWIRQAPVRPYGKEPKYEDHGE